MGKWLQRKIRFAFWSSMISCLVMVGLSVHPKYKNKMIEVVQSIRARQKGEVSTPVPAQTAEQIAAGTKDPSQVSASNKEIIYNGERYVLIQGKYYKARPDNTYTVNGEKVFVVNNRHPADAEVLAAAAAAKKTADASPVSSNTADLPMNPLKIMDNMKKVDEAMKRREEYLEEINNQ